MDDPEVTLPAEGVVTDADLAGRAARGDVGAFRALVLRYQERIFAVLANLLPLYADREDVAQDAFLAAWRHLGEFDPGRGAFFPWLVTIARNRARNVRKRRRPELFSDVPEPAAPAGGPGNLEREEIRRRLDACLGALPEDQRAAFVLSTIHGLSLADVAAIEGVPVGTVKSRAARARAKLRAALGGEP